MLPHLGGTAYGVIHLCAQSQTYRLVSEIRLLATLSHGRYVEADSSKHKPWLLVTVCGVARARASGMLTCLPRGDCVCLPWARCGAGNPCGARPGARGHGLALGRSGT